MDQPAHKYPTCSFFKLLEETWWRLLLILPLSSFVVVVVAGLILLKCFISTLFHCI